MIVSLKYDYLKFPAEPSEAFPRRFSACRPVVPIRLIRGDKDIRYHAIIDSGADLCIFHAQIGEVLGLTIESGKLLKFYGIPGQQLTAYFHDIEIEVGGHKFACYAGFSRDIDNMPYGLLGQVGFFDLFYVILDYKKQRIELRTRE